MTTMLDTYPDVLCEVTVPNDANQPRALTTKVALLKRGTIVVNATSALTIPQAYTLARVLGVLAEAHERNMELQKIFDDVSKGGAS